MKHVVVFVAVLTAVKAWAVSPGHGEAKFSEIMANSSMGVDWVEIENTGVRRFDLAGCTLQFGLTTVKEKRLPHLSMAPGDHVVIAGAPFPPECDYHADFVWSGLKLRSSRPEAVQLSCPHGKQDRVIDRVLFNLRAAKLKKGVSIVLCGGNDALPGLMPGWRPTTDTPFCTILGAADAGGPGLDDTCARPVKGPAILPGDVEITEIMVHPVAGTPEWVELTNTTQQEQKLDGCVLRIGRKSASPTKVVLDGVTIPPVQAVVLSGGAGVTRKDPGIVVKGLRLVDSHAQQIAVVCGGQDVCTVDYDPGVGDIQQGRSLCFEYSEDPARPSKKYLANSLSPYFSNTRGVNYGTPFDPAPCDRDAEIPDPTVSRGCTTTFSGQTGGFWVLLLLLPLFGFRFRRGRQ
jgi:hypothetical protein